MKKIKNAMLALLAAGFAAGRVGWKLLGFRACQSAGIESVEVGGTAVTIRGFDPGSFPAGFCGCYTQEREGTLYVGFRSSTVFGFFETGDFAVVIPVEGTIQEVILKTEASETTIWTEETAAADAWDKAPDVPPETAAAIPRATGRHS